MLSTDGAGAAPRETPRSMANKALVLTLEGTGETRELVGGALSVGRGQDNDWVLVDPGPTPTVSRRHCRFAVGPEGATVTDLGSTNGTRVDGRPLAPRTP